MDVRGTTPVQVMPLFSTYLLIGWKNAGSLFICTCAPRHPRVCSLCCWPAGRCIPFVKHSIVLVYRYSSLDSIFSFVVSGQQS